MPSSTSYLTLLRALRVREKLRNRRHAADHQAITCACRDDMTVPSCPGVDINGVLKLVANLSAFA
jgi:hypothetical protein